jgi:hypothetical protein
MYLCYNILEAFKTYEPEFIQYMGTGAVDQIDKDGYSKLEEVYEAVQQAKPGYELEQEYWKLGDPAMTNLIPPTTYYTWIIRKLDEWENRCRTGAFEELINAGITNSNERFFIEEYLAEQVLVNAKEKKWFKEILRIYTEDRKRIHQEWLKENPPDA